MLSALALLVSCSAPPPLGPGVYTIADAGQTVHHAVGQTVEVGLPAALGRPDTRGELLFYLGPVLDASPGDVQRHRYRVDAPGTARVVAGEFSLVISAREE